MPNYRATVADEVEPVILEFDSITGAIGFFQVRYGRDLLEVTEVISQ